MMSKEENVCCVRLLVLPLFVHIIQKRLRPTIYLRLPLIYVHTYQIIVAIKTNLFDLSKINSRHDKIVFVVALTNTCKTVLVCKNKNTSFGGALRSSLFQRGRQKVLWACNTMYRIVFNPFHGIRKKDIHC